MMIHSLPDDVQFRIAWYFFKSSENCPMFFRQALNMVFVRRLESLSSQHRYIKKMDQDRIKTFNDKFSLIPKPFTRKMQTDTHAITTTTFEMYSETCQLFPVYAFKYHEEVFLEDSSRVKRWTIRQYELHGSRRMFKKDYKVYCLFYPNCQNKIKWEG